MVTGGCGSTRKKLARGLNSVVAFGCLRYVASIHSAALVINTYLGSSIRVIRGVFIVNEYLLCHMIDHFLEKFT